MSFNALSWNSLRTILNSFLLFHLCSAEHSGKPATSNDGVCLSLLVSVRIPLEDVCLIDKYTWLPIDFGDELLSRMGKNLTVPLNVIR